MLYVFQSDTFHTLVLRVYVFGFNFDFNTLLPEFFSEVDNSSSL